MSSTQIQLLYIRFKEGWEDVRSGRPNRPNTDENIEPVKKMSLFVIEVGYDVGISFGLWKAIFTDVLSMRRASADCSKIAKFWAETALHGYRSGYIADV